MKMKVVKSAEKLSEWSTRLVDAGSIMIINGVPYDKQTNTPIPFNTLNVVGGSMQIADSVAGHGLMTGNNIAYEYKEETSPYMPSLIDGNFESSLVDNLDSNISYVLVSSNPGNKLDQNTSSDTMYPYVTINSVNNFATSSPQIHKIEKASDGSFKIVRSSMIPWYCNGARVIYMTQDNDYVYLIVNACYTSISNGLTQMGLSSIKLNKMDMSYIKSAYNPSDYSGPMQAYAFGSSAYASCHELRATTVIKQTEGGLVVLDRHLATSCASTTSSSNNSNFFPNLRGCGVADVEYFNWYRTIAYYYDFALNKWSILNIDGESKPFEVKINYATPTTANMYLRSSDFIRMNYAANSIDISSSTEAYTVDYELTDSYATKTDHPTKCFKFVLQQGDSQTITCSEVTLDFGDGVDGVTQFPVAAYKISDLDNYASPIATVKTQKNIQILRSNIYSTYVTNYDGSYYLHVVLKGYNDNENYGIYVFELNAERTTATLVSVYKPANPTLIDIRFLDSAHKKIAIVDKLGYHFASFDLTNKRWVKNMTVNTPCNYLIFADENTAYAVNTDRSIDMIKLNAAAQVGLTSEKTSYQYQGSDIDSFVTIYAQNSDGDYIAQDVRLTIDGDAIWKSNGLQTLQTTTSAEGPINIPFTIQGETVSNVGIDVIV